MDRDALRQLIERGELGVSDKLSVGASLPRHIWEFPVFADLRQVLEKCGPDEGEPTTRFAPSPERSAPAGAPRTIQEASQPAASGDPGEPVRSRRVSVRQPGTGVRAELRSETPFQSASIASVPARPRPDTAPAQIARRRAASAKAGGNALAAEQKRASVPRRPATPAAASPDLAAEVTVPAQVASAPAKAAARPAQDTPRPMKQEPLELAPLDEFAEVFDASAAEPGAVWPPKGAAPVAAPGSPGTVKPGASEAVADPVLPRAEGGAEIPAASGSAPFAHMSDATSRALDEAQLLVDRFEAQQRTGQERMELTPEMRRAGSARLQPRSTTAEALLVATPKGWEGTAKRGDVVYHVGTAKDGITSTLPVFGAVFALMLGVVFFTGLGRAETASAGAGTSLAFVRAFALISGAVLGVRVIRSESLSRLGFRGTDRAAVVALAGGLAVGVLGFALVPFGVAPNGAVTLGVVLGLVALRAISEALFFEGFVHRVLLVEFSAPLAPHAITAALYALWVSTYAFLWDPVEAPSAGSARLALFIALPAAYAFYRSRAWYVAAWVRWCGLAAAAFAAWSTSQGTL